MTSDPAALLPDGFFDAYAADLHPLTPPEPLGNAGGLSGSRFWRLRASGGSLLVRRWPPGTTPNRLATVHRWVARLGDTIPEVAAPLLDRSGRTFQERGGTLWELTRFLPGTPDLRRPPDPNHLATMFAALAQVHETLSQESTLAPSPGLIARRNELEALTDPELSRLRRIVSGHPASEARAKAERWIDLARSLVGLAALPCLARAEQALALQPVLRDARPDHFLFERGRLTGLVDFGAMDVDSVAADLARLLAEAIGLNPESRLTALAAYGAVRPLSTEEKDLIGVFEGANAVLGGSRWVRWHFVEGRRFDDPRAVERGLTRAVHRLDAWSHSNHWRLFHPS